MDLKCSEAQCEETPVYAYVWAWGEEGRCCLSHRSHLEGLATQLGRGIQFYELDVDGAPRAYKAPTLTALPSELGELRMKVAERDATIVQLNEEIADLKRRLDEAKPSEVESVIEGETTKPDKSEATKDVEVTYVAPHERQPAPPHKRR